MIVFDLLRIAENECQLLARYDVRPSDVRLLPMFEEWREMRSRGEKYEYCTAALGEKYGLSPRSVSRAICRLSAAIDISATI